MSALGSANLQNIATAGLASQNDQPAGPSVLPPFSGKLSEDAGLKLSNENFKQLIENYFDTITTPLSQVPRKSAFRTPYLLNVRCGYFLKGKILTPLSQLTETPPFPTPHVLAQFAYKAYKDYTAGETDAQYETRLALPEGWKLLTTASNITKTNGYFGAAYWHPEHQQVVIAHRGTELTNLGAVWTDLQGVVRNKYVQQMESASTFAHKVVEVLREVKRIKRVSFQLFFTGHSLGGWLAQVTTFTTEYLKREGTFFLRRIDDNDCYHPHTVVFDSPGCKDMLLKVTDKLDVRLNGRSIDIEHLDITSYLSAPNRINTCNAHLGTVYRIFTDLSDMRWQDKHTPWYNVATHSMDKILQAFDPETGQVGKDEEGQLKVQVVVDWPISEGLSGGEEYNKFFEWVGQFNNYHAHITAEYVRGLKYSPIRYQTKHYDEGVNSLNVLSQEEQEFIKSYSNLRQWPEFCKPKELFSVMGNNQAQEEAGKMLQCFEIINDTIRFTEARALQTLVPYVKRLLQLYPGIKEIKNRVLQCEKRPCVQRINQSPLEFKSDALSIRYFVESEEQRVLHLQMVKGDEWTGLIKVYQLLQKADCLMEDQYTVLKLETLLTLNKLLDFNTLRLSSEAKYLMVVVCEATEQLKEETEDMVRKFFENMKQKPRIKVILTSRSEDKADRFLQHIGREIFGNGFVTRDEQLTWSDLTYSSQEKLLKKSVKFQGANVSLNKLMSAESPAANLLPLGALLEEKELTIADPVPISNGYNVNYYIERTFRYQKAIKQDIFNDKNVRDSHVYLARSEEEYTNLCQLHPTNSVHWVEKDKSGKLIWQQSQGSLETLREYIDTDISLICSDGDLDKPSEQAQHQRVMLISDTAGMGKSIVLTHFSEQMKQKFRAKWVVRIDLNNHTDVLKALKKEQIDKEKVIEFVSEKLLKLKRGFEMELFKQCCEQKQKVRIVIMLDGVDEISPFYKETVIGLLQALRQTAVEQLWVTTRPHLREELEDELQQLSYTLERFSEENQIKFFMKFWCLGDWFTEMDSKEREENKKKLEIYAKNLINNLAQSISDKDRQFTGIPLQTRMLAEAFDKKVRDFCQSTESMHELPFKLDLLGLYGRFIERKYDIYHEEKFRVPADNVVAIERRESDFKIMGKDHQLLALKVLFTEEQIAVLESNSQCIFPVEQLTRLGIVQVSHDGELHFIHRTLAEYYVAEYLVNRLTEGNNTSQEAETLILKDIFLKKDYEVIRVFVDGLLSDPKPSEKVLKHNGKWIHDLGEGAERVLHRATQEDNVNIVGLLLQSLQAGEHTDTVIEMLLGQDESGRTAWHNAAFYSSKEVLEKLWKCAEAKLTREEINNKLLLPTDSKGMTAWHVAAWWGETEILQKVWKWAIEKLTREEINNKLLLATDRDGWTIWHMAASSPVSEILQKIWEWAKEKLTTEEINNKLLATDCEGRTVWHVAAEKGKPEILWSVWEWAKEKLTTEEINNKLLLATDGEGRTVWHVAAKKGKPEILQCVWELAKEKLTTVEINNKLLLATDCYGRTVWHAAAEEGRPEILQNVWEWAKENLTTEEINNKLLLATDGQGMTAWHMAAYWGKPEILQKMWELAKEKLTAEEMDKKLLLATDGEGRTVWHVAAEEGKPEIIRKVWELAKEKLTTEEINNKLLLATDGKGRTVWYIAASRGESEILQNAWEFAKEKLTTEDIRNKFLLLTDGKGRTIWHVAAKKGKPGMLQSVWEWAKEKLTTEEINNKLLLATDREGMTIWHVAAKEGKPEILQKVWELAKEKLTTEEINNKLLLAPDVERRTVLHVAAEEGTPEILQKIWELAKEKLTTEEINNKLLLATDGKGRAVWHVAAKRGKSEIFQKVWELAKENLTTEEINSKLLLATDCFGRTVWHVAAEEGKEEILQKVWELAKEKLTREEICNKLFLATDNTGRTVWHVAGKRRLSLLWKLSEWAEEAKLTEEMYKKLVTDSKGRTDWQGAADRHILKILEMVLSSLKRN